MGRSTIGRAFTLVEALVVIAIIALLLGILTPTLGAARRSAALAVEQADARVIGAAYLAFAADHKDYVLPAKIDSVRFPEAVRLARAALPGGGEPTGADATRWIWRLGPYLDFAFESLIRDEAVLEQASGANDLAGQDTGQYRASVFTAFGMNSYFVGGRKEFYETNAQGINRYQQIFGPDFFVRRLDRAKRPAELLAFVSSASNIQNEGFRAGYFYVEPPYTTAPQANWLDFEVPTRQRVMQTGGWYGAFPVANRKAVVNFLDGHAEQLEWDDLVDMRKWSPQANAPDWTLPRPQ